MPACIPRIYARAVQPKINARYVFSRIIFKPRRDPAKTARYKPRMYATAAAAEDNCDCKLREEKKERECVIISEIPADNAVVVKENYN